MKVHQIFSIVSGAVFSLIISGCAVPVTEERNEHPLENSRFPESDMIQNVSAGGVALPVSAVYEPCKLTKLSRRVRYEWSIMGETGQQFFRKYDDILQQKMTPRELHRALFVLLEKSIMTKFDHRPAADYVTKGMINHCNDLWGKVTPPAGDDYLCQLAERFNKLLDMSNQIDSILIDNDLHQLDRFWSMNFTHYYFELCGVAHELRERGIDVPIVKKDYWKNGR